MMSTRVADYFFVAGLHDSHIIPTFDSAKKHQRIADSDVSYYQQQEAAVAGQHKQVEEELPPQPQLQTQPPETTIDASRRRGQSLSVIPTESSLRSTFPEVATSASLLGVLDHVQSVIDNFDKERDTARDNVIAVHEPTGRRHTEKYKGTETIPNNRTTSYPTEATRRLSVREVSARKWRSPSDPKISEGMKKSLSTKRIKSTESVPSIPLQPEIVPNIFDIRYTPTILMRYPKINYSPQEPFPAYAAMFCFPRDISLHHGESPPPEQLHSFAMTDENGATVYGTCVVFYERLADRLKEPVEKAIKEWVKSNMPVSSVEYAQHLEIKINNEKMELEKAQKNDENMSRIGVEERIRTCQENIELYKELLEPVKMGVCKAEDIWVPKSIGLLGRMPWINLYGDWIRILLDNIVGVGGHRNAKPTIDIESTVINLIEEVPLPPPGRFEIGLTINRKPLFFSRPPINQVPILKNFSLYPVFRALSPHLILAVLETLLAEGKVVFLSKYTGMLSLACESFRYLLFPFYWQFVFIPVLPERLLTCLQAPVPYIIGFPGNMTDLEDHAPDDVCIVNLDSNSMHQSQRSMPIPDRQRRKLQSALEQYAPLHTKSKIPYGVPLPVQCTFPKGKMILNCSRSKTTDVFISPAQRNSESSDATSIWSHSASLVSRPSGFWSSNASTRSSNESSTSASASTPAASALSSAAAAAASSADGSHNIPQFPGSALLSTSAGNYASSSSTSLHSPPMSPIRTTASIQSIKSSLSNSSPKQQQRVSLPTPIVNASNPTNSPTLDHQNSYRKATSRRSDPSPKPEDNTRTKISSFMSKPRATFHQEQQIDNNSNSMVGSPRISISSPRFTSTTNFDHGYHNEVPRRVKHIEGHIMAEIFTSELGRFQGYRCVCGRQVSEDDESNSKKPRMFMCCQECHLVTHDTCTDQILHPCLPACFNEQKVLDSFIRMFASLLYNYRTGFVDNMEDKSSPTISANDTNTRGNCLYFSKDKFLKHSDKDTRDFLSSLGNSQMFTQFITDRLLKSSQEPEILVFDEYIKLKLNRSKLKFVKEDTRFLNDESYRVSQIIWATPPPDNVIISQGECKRFPTNLQFYSK
ncbi:AEX-3 domain-containing protein [Mucor mucedo]|uniref:AEX-3 domain-containing protein n=1 Tax=Mucor mucedo TaxID=29922 RepID=UPI0022211514|nr:AEX-3 domain-containing protein [Mucor mucedo]KAI7893814.1 AEX-3 domain-containing protein [Mucor mucedo]